MIWIQMCSVSVHNDFWKRSIRNVNRSESQSTSSTTASGFPAKSQASSSTPMSMMHPRPNSAPSQTDGHARDETVRSAHHRLFGYRSPAPARKRMPRGSSRRSSFPLCALCARVCKQYMEDLVIRLPGSCRSANRSNRSFAE